MVKLFWKRMDEMAEGVGVGGGAKHEGGGKGAPRVVVDYSYEDEEEIKDDTSRQAQLGVSSPCGNVNEQEGSSSSDESIEQDGEGAGKHPGMQQQEGGAAAQEGGAVGQEQEGGEAAQERHVAKKLVADIFVKHSEQAVVFNKLAGDFWTTWNMISESSKSTLKQCDDVVNGVMEERKLLEGARMKLDEMSGKIIEGVAAAITKASEDAIEKQLKLVEEQLVASVVNGIEKAVNEDLFYSSLSPESMKELKDAVRKCYEKAEAGRLEVLTEAMAKGFWASVGPSTRSSQEEGMAGVRSGVERRVHERSVPPSSVGGHVGSPVASPSSRARQTVDKSVEDKEVIVLD
ncbi:unnamed protein product [Closterium sp. NIES-53]